MKVFIISLLLCSSIQAAEKLAIKTGTWRYETNMAANPQMKAALDQMKNLPPQVREQMMKSLKAQGISSSGTKQVSNQCITEDDIKNWESKLRKEMAKGKTMKDCKFNIVKQTKLSLLGKFNCPDKTKNVSFDIKMKSDKEGTSTVVTAYSKDPIVSKMKWVKAGCTEKKKN